MEGKDFAYAICHFLIFLWYINVFQATIISWNLYCKKKKIYGDHVEYLFYFPLGWLRELIVKPDPCFQMDFAPSILVREKSIGDT